MRALVSIIQADLSVDLNFVGSTGFGERLSEEVTLAGDLQERGLELLEGSHDQLVRGREAVQHDVTGTEIRLDGLQVYPTDVAGCLLVLRVLDENPRQGPLEGRIHDEGSGLAFLDTASCPDLFHEVEDIVGSQVRCRVRGRRDVRRDRLDKSTSLARRCVVRWVREGSREERLFHVSRNLLELLFELPSKLVSGD